MPTETLTSRQRVVRTLRREPVDRIPIDLGCHPSSGISCFAYRNLRQHLGLDTDRIWVPDLVQMLGFVDEDVRRRFHLDCVMLEPPWEKTKRWTVREGYTFDVPAHFDNRATADGEWHVHQNGRMMRMPTDGFFFDGDWLSNWGGLDEDQALALYARQAEQIYKESDYATMFTGYSRGGGFWAYFGGLERACRMYEEPEAICQENAKLVEQDIARAGKVLEKLGPWVQMIAIGDDLGTQGGPMCRPSVLERCMAPYLKKLCDFIHRNSDCKTFLHCCGSIRPLIPMLIGCGIDVLNPVQISAADMDPARLKQEFGDRIVFWGGGCDTQNVLGVKTAQEVARHTKETVRIFKRGGGFVFNQVHNVMGNVPPENVVAMLDAAYEDSFYV